jgi:hypothetical protein
LFWPNIEQAYIARAGGHGAGAAAGDQIKGKCPLVSSCSNTPTD